MKILIFGGNGWIGDQFIKLLIDSKIQYFKSQNRAHDVKDIMAEISSINPTHIVSLIGRTHGGNIKTIDYLELPGKLKDNIRDNLYGPLVLSRICEFSSIHFTYLGTGCIFDGYPEKGYNEIDNADFFGSSYSIVKGFTDKIMNELFPNILNLRIRMPIIGETHERNFITKITTYEKICSTENSMTVLPVMLPLMIRMLSMDMTGCYNFTNPGTITHNEILELYKKYVNSEFTWKNFTLEEQDQILLSKRSNNKLNTNKIEQLFVIPNIRDSVIDILKKYKL